MRIIYTLGFILLLLLLGLYGYATLVKTIIIACFSLYLLIFIGTIYLMDHPHRVIKRRFKDYKNHESVSKQILDEIVSLIENTLQTELPEYNVVTNQVPMADFGSASIYGYIILEFKDKPSDEFIKLLERCNTEENKDKTEYDFLHSSIRFIVYKDTVLVRMYFSENDRYYHNTPYLIDYKDCNYHPTEPCSPVDINEILKTYIPHKEQLFPASHKS